MVAYWWGDAPRITVPLAIFPEMRFGVPASRVFGALVKRADNKSGLVDSTIKQLAEDARMGETQVKAGLRALIASGYVAQVRHGNSRVSNKYQVRGVPVTLDQSEIRPVNQSEIRPVREVGPVGNPTQTGRKSDHPLVSPVLSPTTSLASGEAEEDERSSESAIPGLLVGAPKPKTAKPKTTGKAGYSPEFEAFWSAYPVRVAGKARTRGDKVKAFGLFRKLTEAGELSVDQLMALARVYSEDMAGADRAAYVMDATRFLGGRWEDWREAAEAVARQAVGELTDEEINQILGPPRPLPAPPRGVDPGTPAYAAWKTQAIAERRAERLDQALARKTNQTSTVPRQGNNVRSIA